MKKLAAALCLAFAMPAWADLADGIAAYDRKDYVAALKELKPLAEKGDPHAQLALGLMARDGAGVAKDPKAAFEWLRKAAAQDVAPAQFYLGVAYDTGLGVAKDPAEAAKWYEKAAEKGLAAAMYNVGVAYLKGEGVTRDPAKAVGWFSKAANEKKLAAARYNLGVAHAKGEGTEADAAKAGGWLAASQLADLGNPDVQYLLGLAYVRGEGVIRDEPGALELFQKAAAKGHALAPVELAYRYEEGIGTERDPAKALEWRKVAAAKGHVESMFRLGVSLSFGRDGASKNPAEGAQWYKKAAEQGHGAAKLYVAAADMKPRPGEEFKDCDDCPVMVAIPPGRFVMGSPANEPLRSPDEGPQHWVVIAKPFAMGKFEVTRGQYAKFAAETGQGANAWKSPSFSQADDHPVVNVSWEEAKAYVQWLSKKTGKKYRLASEAEWEYSARAGSATAYTWGADAYPEACRHANVKQSCDRFEHTAPAGSFAPNAFGLYDMAGNAWEWVEDCRNWSYQGAPSNGMVWAEGDCGQRVLRGGSSQFEPGYARAAYRVGDSAAGRLYSPGFRLARTE